VVVVEAMVLVVVVAVAVVVEIAVAAAVAPFSPGISLLGPSATPGVSLLVPGDLLAFLLHLGTHICHSVCHLLHHPHLTCNQWVNFAWWRIRRIHLCWLWLGLSKYSPSVSSGR
jgi:hypothetical protein